MPVYTYTTLDNPSAASTTQPLGINDAGQVVGIFDLPIIFSTYYGFLYSGGSYTTLSDPSSTAPNGSGTFAYGINASGQIVGYYQGRNGDGRSERFRYSRGTCTTLDDPVATISTEPAGINAFGQIVGSFRDNDSYHGYLYSGGIYTTLNGPQTITLTHAQGINAAGQIVGWYANASGTHGFLYSGGTYTTLDNPLATSGTFAYGINDAGQIVGTYQDSGGRYHSCTAVAPTSLSTIPWPPPAVAAAAPLHMASTMQARLSASISTAAVGTASSLPSGRTHRRPPAPPPT